MNQKLSLKKLKGIKPKGVKVKPSSKLQSMIELEKKVVDRYGKLEYEFPTSSALSCEFKEESYGNLYRRFEPEFEKSNFSKQDLVNYVNYCFADDSYDTPSELIVRGFYSGALLEYISKQAKQRDEYLCLEINGENNSFDHLFAFARNPCDLFLENATGRKICERFGFHSGFNNLALFNISGDNIGHVLGANSEKGGNIILSNISGNMLFEGALVGTNINSLTASDIKGYCFSQGANLFDLDLIILKNVLDVAGLSFYSTEADVVCFENVSSKDLISAENDFRIFRESYIHLLLSKNLSSNLDEHFTLQFGSSFNDSTRHEDLPKSFNFHKRYLGINTILNLVKNYKKFEDRSDFFKRFDELRVSSKNKFEKRL